MMRKGECRMSLRRAGCLAAIAVISVLSFQVQSAYCITVKPAPFDHIEAVVPTEVMAGVEFEVSVTFVDRFGNPMSENWKPENSLTLHVSQPSSVQPSVLTPDNYAPGFKFSVRTEKMGDLVLSLRDEKGNVLDKWDLAIKSGRPVKLVVDLPSRAEVGETVTMSIQAVDAHGNIAFGYDPDSRSLIFSEGSAALTGEIKARTGGKYEIPVQFRAQGRQTVTVRDRRSGLTGSSAAISVTPAPLASFDVDTASPRIVAGKELALTIRALDRYGNLLDDYDKRYKGVRLYSGDESLAPDLVPPSSFRGGVAKIGIVMKNAGEHTVRVSELQSNVSGEFGVSIIPDRTSSLYVQTPESAVAGEPFVITVTSQDQFANRTPGIEPGTVARLRSTGSGTVKPDIIKAGDFKNGLARVKVTYEKAESFEISAYLAEAGISGTAPTPADEKEKARISAQKAREEAMRARRESRLREERVSGSIAKTRYAPAAPPAARRQSPPESSQMAKPAPQAPEQAPPSRKTAPRVSKAETVKPPAAPSRSPGIPALRPGILDGIKVIEEGNKALVTFATNGMTDYNVTTSAKLSRKWIDIDFPDMKVDLPGRIGGGEEIVGEVYVVPSEDGGPGVKVSVEILPTRIGYDVYQEGQSLVLKVSKQ
jgi:hypothetical protein